MNRFMLLLLRALQTNGTDSVCVLLLRVNCPVIMCDSRVPMYADQEQILHLN